jgi:hypothetical protein
MRLLTVIFIVFFSLLATVQVEAAGELRYGPVQPTEGPGGKSYQHGEMTTWESGFRHERYQVFQPATPKPQKAGLVVLLHDWLTEDPQYYAGLIRHLCRRGNIVLFPHFQGTGAPDEDYHTNIVWIIKDFLLKSLARKDIEVELTRLSYIGHGAGAVLAANFGLPKARTIILLTPHARSLKLLDLTGISRTTRLVIISGDEVAPENDLLAREIFYAADRVRSDKKIFITVLSDYYGQPPLIADEMAALSPERPLYERLVVKRRHEFVKTFRERSVAGTMRTQPIDAFDWLVIFRIFDAIEQLYSGQPGLDIFKDSPQLRFMGYWSDGRKLKGLIATRRP